MNAVRVARQAVENRIIDDVLDSLLWYEPYYRKTKHLRFGQLPKKNRVTKINSDLTIKTFKRGCAWTIS